VRQNKISQHENCYISEILNIFAPNFAHLFVTLLCTNALLYDIYLTYVKLMKTQTSRKNFTTEQKVDFIIKESN